MRVKRIIPNIAAPNIDAAKEFYAGVLGLDVVMDHGWIVTFAAPGQAAPQISVAIEGGAGTPVPDLSIEVDDVDEAHRRMVDAGVVIDYGPVREPWGVYRFFVRDPFGRLINILGHD